MNKETERRTELSDKVTTSLRERTAKTSGKAETDFVEGSEYTRNLKQSSKFSWVWFLLILLAGVSLIVIFLF